MFRKDYQGEYFTLLSSCGPSPLKLWGMSVKNGCIRRVTDEQVMSLALEIAGTNVTTTYIYSPKDPRKTLGIRLPFLTMIVKNLKRYFTFEVTVLDDTNMSRRFRMSNFQKATRIKTFFTSLPMCVPDGWNQMHFNLVDFTHRAYNTNYRETSRVQIHANCRIRRIYFSDRLRKEEDLPNEYRLFFPSKNQKKQVEEKKSEGTVQSLEEGEEEEISEVLVQRESQEFEAGRSEKSVSIDEEVKLSSKGEDKESESKSHDEEFQEDEIEQEIRLRYRELRSEPFGRWSGNSEHE